MLTLRHTSLGMTAGLLAAAVIGIARIFDEAHTVSEIVAGWILGAIVASLFVRAFLSAHIKLRRPVIAAVSLLLVSTVSYGHHAPFQTIIERYSPWLCNHEW